MYTYKATGHPACLGSLAQALGATQWTITVAADGQAHARMDLRGPPRAGIAEDMTEVWAFLQAIPDLGVALTRRAALVAVQQYVIAVERRLDEASPVAYLCPRCGELRPHVGHYVPADSNCRHCGTAVSELDVRALVARCKAYASGALPVMAPPGPVATKLPGGGYDVLIDPARHTAAQVVAAVNAVHPNTLAMPPINAGAAVVLKQPGVGISFRQQLGVSEDDDAVLDTFMAAAEEGGLSRAMEVLVSLGQSPDGRPRVQHSPGGLPWLPWATHPPAVRWGAYAILAVLALWVAWCLYNWRGTL